MILVCKKCNEEQPETCFIIRKDTGKRRGACRTCRSLSNKEWKEKNRDHVRAEGLKWQTNNREKCRASSLAWAKKNKSKICANTVSYKVRKVKAQPIWLSAIHLAQIFEMYDVALAKTVQTGIIHHVDHIHPLNGENICGLHVPWNLQVITAAENISKGNRIMVPKTGPLT